MGEKVAFHQGLGWDGQWYYSVCQDFLQKIFHHTYDTYRLQRILPFAIINIIDTLLGIKPTIANCTHFINGLNLFMILLGVLMFMKISDYLKLSTPVEIFGFSALFLNYPTLKLMGYYPFLTDTFALSIAICQVYYFICTKKIPLFLIIIGAFVWPTLLVMGLLLAYMPADSVVESTMSLKKERVLLKIIKFFVMSFVPLAFIALLAVIYIKYGSIEKFEHLYQEKTTIYILGISLGSVVLYFWYMLNPIKYNPISQLKTLFTLLNLPNVIKLVLIFLSVHFIIHYLSNGTELVSFWQMILGRLIIPPTIDPFIFVVTGFMYFGPCILFLLFYWRGVLQVATKWGYSYLMLVSLGVVMFINPESRHFTTFLPVFIIPLLDYMNFFVNKLSFQKSILILIGSLLISRFWYQINVPGIEMAFDQNLSITFPAQRYFMSHGPWMSHQMYFVFLIVTVFSGLLLIYTERKNRLKCLS